MFEACRRKFTGIHFFYDLCEDDVAIDDIDPRPISEIPLSKPQIVNGVECKTIAQYLKIFEVISLIFPTGKALRMVLSSSS